MKKNYYQLEQKEKDSLFPRMSLINQLNLQLNDLNLVVNSILKPIYEKAGVDFTKQDVVWDANGFYINDKKEKPEEKKESE